MINQLSAFFEVPDSNWRSRSSHQHLLFRVSQGWRILSSSFGAVDHSAVKRVLDVVLALAALLLLAPLLVMIALLVKLDGGPAFFLQTRIGQDGRPFRMVKFRSMQVNAEASLDSMLKHNSKAQGVTFKLENDPRITRVGAVIRRLSLDELPQFFNVLTGEMSIVGPRPALQREVDLYDDFDRLRLRAKPGITCLWQIGERQGKFWELGDRNKIDFKEQVELDVRYLNTPSLLLDLRIMLKTVPAMFLGK